MEDRFVEFDPAEMSLAILGFSAGLAFLFAAVDSHSEVIESSRCGGAIVLIGLYFCYDNVSGPVFDRFVAHESELDSTNLGDGRL